MMTQGLAAQHIKKGEALAGRIALLLKFHRRDAVALSPY
jgi:hypothetical protein